MSGTLQVIQRAPLWLRTELSGRFDLELANEFTSTIDAWRGRQSGVTCFHDCSRLVDYDVAARERVSAWSRAEAEAFDSIHLLVQRRTIAWAIRLVSAVSGVKLVSYHSLESFETAYARHVGGALDPRG